MNIFNGSRIGGGQELGVADGGGDAAALEVEQARYEVVRAQRQYDAVDPTNRLVAGTLERRWNDTMKQQSQREEELAELVRARPCAPSVATRTDLMALADDLPRLWDHPDSPPDLKKRIVRAVLNEITVNSQGDSVHLVLHWQGGDHTELHIKKTPIGQHRHVTSAETIELIRSLARLQSDERIAATINRLGHRTAHGQTWNAMRICAIRNGHDIAVYRDGERQARGEMTVDEAAAAMKVTPTTVLRLIRHKALAGKQACRHAPWVICKSDLDHYLAAKAGNNPPTGSPSQLALEIQ